MNKPEDAETHFTPWRPFDKNRNTNRKCGAAEISNTSGGGAQVSATGAKQGRGCAGAELCYYKYD